MLQLPTIEGSLWREDYIPFLYPPLQKNCTTDVVIIGAGITGLTTAYLLKQSGYKVVVLEKDTIGGGTTGRTTGKVTSQHNLVYADLQERLGKQVAYAYATANQAALEQIGRIIEVEKIGCGWQLDDNYVFTTENQKIGLFKKEATVAAGFGLPASFETATPLPFKIQAAVKFKNQAKINAQKYVLALAARTNDEYHTIYEQSPVIDIKDGDSPCVKTREATVRAKHIVVASNVPIFPLIARGTYCFLEYPTESYIVAGESSHKLTGMYISPDKGNFSILPIHHNDKQMILVGGKGHLSGLRGNKKARYRHLARYAEEHFEVTTITHRWSDRDYIAYDGIPLVGKPYGWSKNMYAVTALKKWGLTNGTAAAMAVHDFICGKPNPWSAVFNPHRAGVISSIPHTIRSHLFR